MSDPFVRKYTTDADPGPFMGIIKKLSFNVGSMDCEHGGPRSLTRRIPEGIVTVKRVLGVEYVTITPMGKVIRIILSSAKVDESYYINFRMGKGSVVVGNTVHKFVFPATFFDATFIAPNYDRYSETCPFIYTLNHKTFITVVSGANEFQIVEKKRDDWHNNNYTNVPDLEIFQKMLSYYKVCTHKDLGEVLVGFSFSPFTYNNGLSHLDRYIDHTKRLYIPILGRGEKLDSKLSGCEGYPFGKKPFTLTSKGMTRYKEVVKPSGNIASPDTQRFNLWLFWPFAPYMHEIPYLNIQFQQGNPLVLSLQDIESLYEYKMYYNEGENKTVSFPLRVDSASGSFPDEVITHVEDGSRVDPDVYRSGSWSSTDTQSQSWSYNIKKSSTIGTVGNLKDIFVETELNGQWMRNYESFMTLTRSTNYPEIYYKPEFLDDVFWPCESNGDTTNSASEVKSIWNNIITGIQNLQIGDILIDSGSILLDYKSENLEQITHNGVSSHSKTGCTIQYTTLQMQVDEVQSLSVEGGDVLWEIIGGGGSISDPNLATTNYTAPSTNVECANNPTIRATVNGEVLETITLAVNAVQTSCALGSRKTCVTDRYPTSPRYICCKASYNCRGEQRLSTCGASIGADCCTYGCATTCVTKDGSLTASSTYAGALSACDGIVDDFVDARTALLKTQGCCPEQLL